MGQLRLNIRYEGVHGLRFGLELWRGGRDEGWEDGGMVCLTTRVVCYGPPQRVFQYRVHIECVRPG